MVVEQLMDNYYSVHLSKILEEEEVLGLAWEVVGGPAYFPHLRESGLEPLAVVGVLLGVLCFCEEAVEEQVHASKEEPEVRYFSVAPQEPVSDYYLEGTELALFVVRKVEELVESGWAVGLALGKSCFALVGWALGKSCFAFEELASGKDCLVSVGLTDFGRQRMMSTVMQRSDFVMFGVLTVVM